MTDAELCLATRDTYRRLTMRHGATRAAFAACVQLLRRNRPNLSISEIRRMVARMLAVEPIA